MLAGRVDSIDTHYKLAEPTGRSTQQIADDLDRVSQIVVFDDEDSRFCVCSWLEKALGSTEFPSAPCKRTMKPVFNEDEVPPRPRVRRSLREPAACPQPVPVQRSAP